MRRRGGGAGMQGFGFDEDIDPADIFNMFFNGGMGGGMGGFGGPGFRVHSFNGSFPFQQPGRARAQANARARQDPRMDDSATVIRNILHLLPLLIPLFMYFLSPGEEIFSMVRTKEHPNAIHTGRMNLPFWANRQTFDEKYPIGKPQRESMENRIENEIIIYKRRQCDYERSSWSSRRPNCEYLKELQKDHPNLRVYSPW
jgi:DnaJ family protein B protein 12